MVHPLSSEVVNYVTQRTTSMMAVFYLLMMYCSVRALASTSGRWCMAAIAACAAGMACQESMVTAPVMVALFDRAYAPASRRLATHRGRLYAGLAGTWLVLAMLLAERPRTTVGFDTGVGAWTYLLNQTTVIVDYLRLTIWPRGLVLDYGLPQPMILADVIVPGLIVLALASAVTVALALRPGLGFPGAWFFVTLAPTSSVVPIATEVGAERRMYLAMAGLVVLAVLCAYRMWFWGVATAFRGRSLQALMPCRGRIGTAVAIGTLICLCTTLAAATVGRNREYQSWLSLSKTTVDRRPHGRAYLHYGTALLEAGRRKEAVDYFRRSAVDYPGAHFALGNELIGDGNLEAGAEQLERFVEQMPTHVNVVPARETLGSVYLILGRDDAAATQLTEVLRWEPHRRDTHLRLGEIRSKQGRFAEAIRHFRFLVERRPQDTEALRKLGAALAASGRADSGAAVLERAASIAPQDLAVRLLFGRVLAMAGRLDEAAEQFARAVDIEPHNDDARRDLTRALAQAASLRAMRR
jgi:tetratricopeptide (TPR) repeat protein